LDAPQESSFYTEPWTETLAEVRDRMSRRGDFGPNPDDYTHDSSIFEVLAALEALAVEDEVLA
jgi:hypothetical protein